VTAPSFSVVVPAYNAAGTVAEAIDSAVNQTVRPLEIIVVDDGSTDDTQRSLAPYASEVTLIRKENGGGASAFNAGLRSASGEFVAVLDADDVYEPGRIEALGALGSERPELDLLATDVYLEVDGQVVGRFSTGTPFAYDDQRVNIFDRCFVCVPAMRRERLLAIGGQDESLRIAYDWDCYLRLILAGARAGFVDAPLYRYRLGADGLTGDRPASLRERVTMLEKAMTNPHLRPEEREPLRRAIAANTSRTLLVEAEAALRSRTEGARRRAAAVTVGRGFGLRTRVKAGVATLAPKWAARHLALREERGGGSRMRRSRST
jgi:glycosyltransferase involved in cell wall biosynthesis